MRELTLITGGVRSGKSSYAQQLAEEAAGDGKALFLATCPPIDEELRTRIARHRADRDPQIWETAEEETRIDRVLQKQRDGVILLDCLTLWVGNLLHYNARINEDAVADLARGFLGHLKNQRGQLIAVTNEAGLGVVPDNAQARLYRDLLGRCNQVFAAAASRVILMVSGIPVTIKGAS